MKYIFLVKIIESERGWGAKEDSEMYFSSYENAEKYATWFNSKNNSNQVPDIYWYANEPIRVVYEKSRHEKYLDKGIELMNREKTVVIETKQHSETPDMYIGCLVVASTDDEHIVGIVSAITENNVVVKRSAEEYLMPKDGCRVVEFNDDVKSLSQHLFDIATECQSINLLNKIIQPYIVNNK